MNVRLTRQFQREFKALQKRYRSLQDDVGAVVAQLQVTPRSGTALGNDCYKIRVAIRSKGKGKSGGGRLITYVRIQNETVYLLSIYDKSEQDTIMAEELQKRVGEIDDE